MGSSSSGRRGFLVASVLAPALLSSRALSGATMRRPPAVPEAGRFRRIYDPGAGEPEPWYINDHCLVPAPDGWHLFGITHAEPAAPEDEDVFAHATAPELHGPWREQPPALVVDTSYGETHLWAPFVVAHDGVFHMFYAGGGPDRTRAAINLATSTDLVEWTRHPGGPLFHDGYDARDPMVRRVGGSWVMYYTATDDPAGGRHVVAYRSSDDLLHWSRRRLAFTGTRSGTFGGDTESPFVVTRGDHHYLFTGPCGGGDDGADEYVCTTAYRSTDPLHFTPDDRVSRLPAHAPEIVHGRDGSWWITHAGWGQGGVHLAPLHWR